MQRWKVVDSTGTLMADWLTLPTTAWWVRISDGWKLTAVCSVLIMHILLLVIAQTALVYSPILVDITECVGK